jgi:hypothetical protein
MSWPGLTTSLVTKHLAKSLATSKDHPRMKQTNLRSTKINPNLPLATSLDFSLSQEPHNACTHVVFTSILSSADIRKSHSDQTGKFPVPSSRGCNHDMVLCGYNSNTILSKPLKMLQASKLTKAWTKLHTCLQWNGFTPELHILVNECSEELKEAFQKYRVTHQLVPPHVHHCDAAEWAVQTWKIHFSSGLATCDPKFPLTTEWDLLMPQADPTLNLTRSAAAGRRPPVILFQF